MAKTEQMKYDISSAADALSSFAKKLPKRKGSTQVKNAAIAIALASKNFAEEAAGKFLSEEVQDKIADALIDITISLNYLGNVDRIKNQIPGYGEDFLPVFAMQKICFETKDETHDKKTPIGKQIVDFLTEIQKAGDAFYTAIKDGSGTVEFKVIPGNSLQEGVINWLKQTEKLGAISTPMHGSRGQYEKYIAFLAAKNFQDVQWQDNRIDVKCDNYCLEVKHDSDQKFDIKINGFLDKRKHFSKGKLTLEGKNFIIDKGLTFFKTKTDGRIIVIDKKGTQCEIFSNATSFLDRCEITYKGESVVSCRLKRVDKPEIRDDAVSESSKISLTYGQLVRLIESVNKSV